MRLNGPPGRRRHQQQARRAPSTDSWRTYCWPPPPLSAPQVRARLQVGNRGQHAGCVVSLDPCLRPPEKRTHRCEGDTRHLALRSSG